MIRPVDRMPGFGPITAFAVGEAPASGYEADGSGGSRPINRGGPHVLAAVGHGKSGALVSIRGGIVPWQASSVPLAGEVCTGTASVILFSNLNRILLGYFDPINVFCHKRVTYFSG